MTITLYRYGDTEPIIFDNVESFEFRCNHCTSWIVLKYSDGKQVRIEDVCVIKS